MRVLFYSNNRRSVPFGDCRFPQAGTLGKNVLRILTNLRFSPDVGQKKEQTKSKDLICSLWCRWSVPFGDCRFPQAGTLGKNVLRILTNLRFSPDVGQKKEQTKSEDLICSLWCRWSGSNRHGIATTGF